MVKWRKGLARNQDKKTHPVMREKLDLSWDDVRAEAEQRNVGQTFKLEQTFWNKKCKEKRVEVARWDWEWFADDLCVIQ